MIVLQGNSLSKSYGAETVFKDISLAITNKDKAGLVGPNGVGKSTLMKCLVGEESIDEGIIIKAKNIKIAYLAQSSSMMEMDMILLDYVMDEYSDLVKMRQELHLLQQKISQPEVHGDAKKLQVKMNQYSVLMEKYEGEGGYSFESKAKGVLVGLGFTEDDLNRSLITFSGGQKTRIALAKILLRSPELLMLDEPTNYLDLKSLDWLENYLINYSGAILLVSHDRYFLNQVTNKTFEMKSSGLEMYPGGYSKYLVLKKEREETHKKAYAKQQEHIKQQEEYIRKYKAGIKSKQARGRQLILNRMQRIDSPDKTGKKINLQFKPDNGTGEKVLEVENLQFSYPGNELFSGLSLALYNGEKTALIGDNGSGKTTLLKIIIGQIAAQGNIKLGARVKWAYFSQEHEDLNLENTVLEEAWLYSSMTANQVRSVLGRFLFTGDSVEKKVSVLSGGERSRLMLAKLFLQNANLLILDEPTNHLDVETREVLEGALEEFSGNLLFISHDRYFINRLADRVMELDKGKIINYLGDFDYYKWKKRDMELEKEAKQLAQVKKQKSIKRVQPKIKKTNIADVEIEIAELEQKLSMLSDILGDNETYCNPQEVIVSTEQYKKVEQKLQGLYQYWENLMENKE